MNKGHECSLVVPGLSGTAGADQTQDIALLNSYTDALVQEGHDADFASKTGVALTRSEVGRNNTEAGLSDALLEDVLHEPQLVADMNSEEDMLGVVPILLAELAAGWQNKTGVKFTALVNCEVAIPTKLASEFDCPVPIPLQIWLAEPIVQQHALLNLLGCSTEEVLAGIRYAGRVQSMHGSSVCIVLSAVQRYRLHTLSLDDGMQPVARLQRGAALFRAAQKAHRYWKSPVIVMQMAHTAMIQNAQPEKLTCVFQGFAGGQPADILLDTGASTCFMSRDLARRAGLKECQRSPIQVTLADGQIVTVQRAAEVPLQMGRFRQKALSCYILPAAAHDVILGEPWLKQYRALIEYDAEQGAIAHIWRGKRRVRVQSVSSVPCMRDKVSARTTQRISQTSELLSRRHMQAEAKHACSSTGLTPAGDQHFVVMVRCRVQQHLAASANVIADTGEASMTPEQAQLHAVLNEYSDILTAELPAGVPGERPGAGEVVPMQPGSRPVYRPPYRLSPAEQAEVVRTVQELLAKGFIRPSTSPFGAPVLFVAKKDGTLRMCVDYRGLNNVTVHNKYPLPRIDEMLDRLQGAQVFSSLDLASGYHQLGLWDSDVPKTAFCTPDGLYEFLVMPFGLTNAPAVFQNTMDSIFRGCRAFVCVYMDDLLVFSRSHGQHMQHLRTVLDLLRRNRLFVKPSKGTWLKAELSFLGHLVGQDGIKVDPAKIQVVREYPRPQNLQQLRQFLGLTNYFRRFVQGYAARVTPLVRLTKKDVPFEWSAECHEAFEQLKEYLVSAPVLAMPDFNKAWELVSDACGFAIGAVLLQEGRPVAYYARSLSSAERNYHATDQELLGCVDALKHWRCYLEGAGS